MPDYSNIYSVFIADRKSFEYSLSSYEVHHINPRCLGGGNEKDNLIRLKPDEHLFAHILLAKIHGGKLVASAIRMSGMKRYRGRHNRERYGHLRSQMSRDMIGNKRGRGVKHTDQFKRELSERSTGKRYALGIKRSEEFKENGRKRMLGNKLGLGNRSQTGLPWTDERREKQRVRMLGNTISRKKV